jgi:hypothetical protein
VDDRFFDDRFFFNDRFRDQNLFLDFFGNLTRRGRHPCSFDTSTR